MAKSRVSLRAFVGTSLLLLFIISNTTLFVWFVSLSSPNSAEKIDIFEVFGELNDGTKAIEVVNGEKALKESDEVVLRSDGEKLAGIDVESSKEMDLAGDPLREEDEVLNNGDIVPLTVLGPFALYLGGGKNLLTPY